MSARRSSPSVRLRVLREHRDADRGLHRDRQLVELERARERLVDPLRGRGGGRLVAQDHPELVAAETGDGRVPHDRLHARADLLQELVAGVVAERVVQFLEAVEVDRQQREARAAPPADVDRRR